MFIEGILSVVCPRTNPFHLWIHKMFYLFSTGETIHPCQATESFRLHILMREIHSLHPFPCPPRFPLRSWFPVSRLFRICRFFPLWTPSFLKYYLPAQYHCQYILFGYYKYLRIDGYILQYRFQPFAWFSKYSFRTARLSFRNTPDVTCGFQNEFLNTILEQLHPALPRICSRSVLLAP